MSTTTSMLKRKLWKNAYNTKSNLDQKEQQTSLGNKDVKINLQTTKRYTSIERSS